MNTNKEIEIIRKEYENNPVKLFLKIKNSIYDEKQLRKIKPIRILDEYYSYLYLSKIEENEYKNKDSEIEFYSMCKNVQFGYFNVISLKYFDSKNSNIKNIFDKCDSMLIDEYRVSFLKLKKFYLNYQSLEDLKMYIKNELKYNQNDIINLKFLLRDLLVDEDNLLLTQIINTYLDKTKKELIVLNNLFTYKENCFEKLFEMNISCEILLKYYEKFCIRMFNHDDLKSQYKDLIKKYFKFFEIRQYELRLNNNMYLIDKIEKFYLKEKSMSNLDNYISSLNLSIDELYETVLHIRNTDCNRLINDIFNSYLEYKRGEIYIFEQLLKKSNNIDALMFLHNNNYNMKSIKSLYKKANIYKFNRTEESKIKSILDLYVSKYDEVLILGKKNLFYKVQSFYEKNKNKDIILDYINNKLSIKGDGFVKMKFQVRNILTKEELNNYNEIILLCFSDMTSSVVMINNILLKGFNYINELLDLKISPAKVNYCMYEKTLEMYNLTPLEKHKVKTFVKKYLEEYENKKADNIKAAIAENVYRHKEASSINLNKCVKIVEEYLKENLNREVTNEELKAIAVLKKENHKLYYEYFSRLKNKDLERCSLAKIEAYKIIECIKNGIYDGNVRREFDIIDYYKKFDVDPMRIFEMSKSELNCEEFTLLSKFSRQANINDGFVYEDIFRTSYSYGAKFDTNGKLIPNSLKELTEEEKNMLVNYLNENNIPINKTTYYTLLNHYIKGYTNFDEYKNIKKLKYL